MTKVILVATLLFTPRYGVPQDLYQENPLAVTDVSESGAPVSVSGSAYLSSKPTSKGIESNLELKATLKNVSSKPIMAFETVVDISASYGGGDRVISREDYFFSNHAFMPGSTTLVSVPPHSQVVYSDHSGKSASTNSLSPSGRADVRVTFVQFDDGTTFGACVWAGGLDSRRQEMTKIMRGLLQAFDKDREIGLDSAIKKQRANANLSSEIAESLEEIQHKFVHDGAEATVLYLKKSLVNAERNSRPEGVRRSTDE